MAITQKDYAASVIKKPNGCLAEKFSCFQKYYYII